MKIELHPTNVDNIKLAKATSRGYSQVIIRTHSKLFNAQDYDYILKLYNAMRLTPWVPESVGSDVFTCHVILDCEAPHAD